VEQLDLRDQFIRNAYYQFEKNDIQFIYKNPKLISSSQLENIPYRPKIIKIIPSHSSIEKRKFLFNTPTKVRENNNNINKNKDSSGSGSEKKKIIKKINLNNNYEKLRNEKIENLEKVKKQLMGKVNSSKKRQYNSEILSLFHNHPIINKNNKMNGLNINDFIRMKKINISNNHINNINNLSFLNNSNLSAKSLKPINQKSKKVQFILKPNIINIPKILNNGPLSDRAYNRRYLSNSAKILNDDNYSKNNNTLTSKLENEVQKKVKTILKKNYIGRYKSSPYLKYLDE